MAGDNTGPGGRTWARAAELDRLGAAIEELAAAAQCRADGEADITERLARLWEMVAALDPELARRLAEYGG